MQTKMHKQASLVVYFYEGWLKKPIRVIYAMQIWKGWVLEHFYGLWFWSIFGFFQNVSRIHPSAIGILSFRLISTLKYIFTKIMSFYGVFVTFENLDFREMFCPYWKSDEPNITFDDAKLPSVTPSKIHKVIWGCCYCITCSSLRSFVFFKFFTNLHNILWKRVESWDHPNAFKLFTSIWAGFRPNSIALKTVWPFIIRKKSYGQIRMTVFWSKKVKQLSKNERSDFQRFWRSGLF